MALESGTKKIRIALFHRDDWHRGEPRIDGQFSYEVPQFEVTHFPIAKGFQQDLHGLRGKCDIVFWDDGKYKDYAGFTPEEHTGYVPPVVMYALYPTLTAGHFTRRVARANKNADLVLLDHDSVYRWEQFVKVPVRRLAYAVNERYYNDRGMEKDIDVGFYNVYAWNKERPAMDRWLAEYCKRNGLKYQSTQGQNVGTQYVELLARTKVVVHMNRTRGTRAPRMFDAAACGCCLVSNRAPVVSGEHFEPGTHYIQFLDPESKEYAEYAEEEIPIYGSLPDVESALEVVLSQEWKRIGEAAKEYVLACHTWERRSWQLYRILLDVFSQLRSGRDSWMY